MKKKKNIGTIERMLRVALGIGLVISAAVEIEAGGGLILLLLHVAVIAFGVDLVVTGMRGYCPLYNWLGWSTAEPEAQP